MVQSAFFTVQDLGTVSSLESGGSSQKRVTFSHDVEKRKGDDVAIDVSRLDGGDSKHYWESYYGASGKFAGHPDEPVLAPGGAGKTESYSAVFSSPYFDYRRTHSRVMGSL